MRAGNHRCSLQTWNAQLRGRLTVARGREGAMHRPRPPSSLSPTTARALRGRPFAHGHLYRSALFDGQRVGRVCSTSSPSSSFLLFSSSLFCLVYGFVQLQIGNCLSRHRPCCFCPLDIVISACAKPNSSLLRRWSRHQPSYAVSRSRHHLFHTSLFRAPERSIDQQTLLDPSPGTFTDHLATLPGRTSRCSRFPLAATNARDPSALTPTSTGTLGPVDHAVASSFYYSNRPAVSPFAARPSPITAIPLLRDASLSSYGSYQTAIPFQLPGLCLSTSLSLGAIGTWTLHFLLIGRRFFCRLLSLFLAPDSISPHFFPCFSLLRLPATIVRTTLPWLCLARPTTVLRILLATWAS